MKILVIGHTVVDRIFTKGNEIVKPGGIFHSIIALKNISEKKDEIYLCSAVSKTGEDIFAELYNKINRKYVNYVDRIPEVKLTLHDGKEREEIYNNINQNLIPPMDDLNDFDGIFINMITGFDVTLKQMERIRKGFKGVIYFDVHTFSRGVTEDMNRYFRRIPEFFKWASNIDILQANEKEMQTLSGKSDEIEIAAELISYGIEFIIVTKAEQGATLFFNKDDKIESVFIESIKVNAVNKVGCGDIFGAVFFYNYIKSGDIIDSLRFANITAGVSTLYSHIDEFKNLKRDVLQRYS